MKVKMLRKRMQMEKKERRKMLEYTWETSKMMRCMVMAASSSLTALSTLDDLRVAFNTVKASSSSRMALK